MGCQLQFAVLRLLEGQAGLQFVSLITESRLHRHQPRLAVVHQGFHVLLRKLLLVDAALAQFLPVHVAVRYQVRSLRLLLCRGFLRFSRLWLLHVFFLFQFFCLFHFFCLFNGFVVIVFLFDILCFCLLLVLGGVHLVRGEHVGVCQRVFQQVLDDRQHSVHRVRRHPVEAEARRLLALAVEVLEEIVNHVPVAVEAQEVLRVFRLGGLRLGIALAVQPGDHADFARLLVADDQHVLFVFLFLFHFRCFLMGY